MVELKEQFSSNNLTSRIPTSKCDGLRKRLKAGDKDELKRIGLPCGDFVCTIIYANEDSGLAMFETYADEW